MGGKAIKIISLVATVVGLGANVVSSIMGDKQRKIDIAEEVKKAMNNK